MKRRLSRLSLLAVIPVSEFYFGFAFAAATYAEE